MEELAKCVLCPHHCQVDRLQGNKGRCKCDDTLKIALASIHYYEEPCISGKQGSGTIFFSNCNLNCIYCQNYEISQLGKGKEITIEHLAQIFLDQQEKGVNNINLVTPTMYVYQIIEAIKLARKNGLHLPIVYNTNGYETVETIQKLAGYIDIYLPDLKYYSDELAKKYSGVSGYFINATKAIQAMYQQVGLLQLNEDGIATRGVLIRHLVLPNHLQNSKHILKWIKENMPPEISVSVMAQYFPTYKAKQDALLNRKLTQKEYKEIENFFYTLDFKNGYIQELGDHEEEYVPKFDLSD
ncbi:MAG: radical SAM protein [Clostridia bacterium]|nr:radical SAM protein [Clostridia bacterium]